MQLPACRGCATKSGCDAFRKGPAGRPLSFREKIMARLPLMNNPFFLGFDHLESLLDSVAKASSDGYPPYNIEHLDDRSLRISLALAGFKPDDISVTVEDHQLTIQGRQEEGESKRAYLHRGIAARQFIRKFVLAEGMEVGEAYLDEGLLHIELTRPEPQHKLRTIEIKAGPPAR